MNVSDDMREGVTARPDMPHSQGRRSVGRIFTACIALWVVLTFGGTVWMWRYATLEGPTPTPPRNWPDQTNVQRDYDRWLLVMSIHPQCPCTRASLEQLARVMRYSHHNLDAALLFQRPAHLPESWAKTSLFETALTIPGVTAIADVNGYESQHFGLKVSGSVALYDRGGHLRFAGGITAARGHAGDNPGSDAVIALVNDEPTNTMQTRVFGCELISDQCATTSSELRCARCTP